MQSDIVDFHFVANLETECTIDEEELYGEDGARYDSLPGSEMQDPPPPCSQPIEFEPPKKRARVWQPRRCFGCGLHKHSHEHQTYCRLNKLEYDAMMKSRHARRQQHAGEQKRLRAAAERAWLRMQINVLHNNLFNSFYCPTWGQWR